MITINELKDWMKNLYDSVKAGSGCSAYAVTAQKEGKRIEYFLYSYHPLTDPIGDDEKVLFLSENCSFEDYALYDYEEGKSSDAEFFNTMMYDIYDYYMQDDEEKSDFLTTEFSDRWAKASISVYNKMKKEEERKMKKMSEYEAKTKKGIRKLFTDLYFFFITEETGDTVCHFPIKYFKTEKEIIEYMKNNEGIFGGVYFEPFDPHYESDDEEEYSPSFIDWEGEGYYVSWDWGEDHIQRIDKAYIELLDEYNPDNSRDMTEEDFKRIEEWLKEEVL